MLKDSLRNLLPVMVGISFLCLGSHVSSATEIEPILIALEVEHTPERVDLFLSTLDFDELFCGFVGVQYPAESYTITHVELMGEAKNAMSAVNNRPGDLRIAFAGTDTCPAGRYLQVSVVPTGMRGLSTMDFDWFRMRINDNRRPVEIVMAPAADVPGMDAVVPDAAPLVASPTVFGEATHLQYTLSEPGSVRLAILSSEGRVVRLLEQGYRQVGTITAVWDGRATNGDRVPSGVYYCLLDTPKERATKRVVLLR
ncbi:MAG: hypothetical protein KAY32_18250 [Candidatus Eisenbacteria sp.]|nr:hypothetical protein [Candidatus Eisenbacteria bacterium]